MAILICTAAQRRSRARSNCGGGDSWFKVFTALKASRASLTCQRLPGNRCPARRCNASSHIRQTLPASLSPTLNWLSLSCLFKMILSGRSADRGWSCKTYLISLNILPVRKLSRAVFRWHLSANLLSATLLLGILPGLACLIRRPPTLVRVRVLPTRAILKY